MHEAGLAAAIWRAIEARGRSIAGLRIVVTGGAHPPGDVEAALRLHLAALLTQNLPGEPLKPRFVLVLDRCCWALRVTLDAGKGSFGLAFLYGGQAAGLLLSEEGVKLGGAP